VSRAAKHIASFFNGQVVRLDDAAPAAGEASAKDAAAIDDPDLGGEGEDVPF
jgi:hypothetical protein